ncbi:MAG: hypothetical protein ACLFPB_03425 [Desulfovermiculus sp.]
MFRLVQFLVCLLGLWGLLGQAHILQARTQADVPRDDEKRGVRGYTLVVQAQSIHSRWIRATARVEADFDCASCSGCISSLSLVLEDVNIRQDQDWVPLPSIELTARGPKGISAGQILFEDIRCRIGSSLVGQGRLKQEALGWTGDFVLHPAKLFKELGSIWPWLSQMHFAGKESPGLRADLAWHFAESGQASTLELDIETRSSVRWQHLGPGTDLILPPLTVSFKFNLEDGGMSWNLQANDNVRWGMMAAARLASEGKLKFLPSGMHIVRAAVNSQWIGRLDQDEQGREVHIQAQDIDIRPASTRLQKMKLDMQGLGAFEITGQWGEGKDSRLTAQASDLQMSGVRSWLQSAGYDPAAGWDIQGRGDMRIEAEKDTQGIYGNWGLDFQDVGGSSPDGEIMAAGLGGQFQGSGVWDESPRASFSLSTEQGEVLWGTRYADLGQSAVSLTGQGRVRPGQDVQITKGDIRAGEYFDMQANAELGLGPDSSQWEVNIAQGRAELEGLSSAVQGLVPSGWKMQGRVGWEGKVSSSEAGPMVQGRISGQDVSLEVPESGMEMKNWQVALPVRYLLDESPAGEDYGKDFDSWGVLRPGNLRIAGREIEVAGARVGLIDNVLQLRNEVEIGGEGFRAGLNDFSLDLPWSGPWQGKGELMLYDLQPARLLDPALQNSLQDSLQDMGRLQGMLEFAASAQEVQTQGAIRGALFSADVRIEDIGLKRPLEPSRLAQANVHIRGLDLEALSQSLGVGRITGKMNADVQRLGLAYGQPVRFHLRAKSVPDPEQSRRISLQAVNSLSIIGTGQGLSGLGIQFYAQFFKQFPYEQIGLSCVLANDVFSLNGLIREDGVEYIVKRGWTGINVINTNPNNMIAFSDMLDRLERVYTQAE